MRFNLRGQYGPLAVAALVTVGVLVLAGIAGMAKAATTVVVTQNSSDWAPMDTRPGGAHRFTEDYGAPAGLGTGSLELTTDATTAAKADYWTFAHAGTILADVNDLSYWTYQANTPQVPHAAVSYQVQIDGNGALEGGFTTLVYEPYQNPASGPIVPSTWQNWDVDAGLLWSTRTVPECGLVGAPGGPAIYTLAAIKALCPNAVVLGVGVNIGTFNPGYTVATDGVQFNDTIYNFELGRRPASKDECKNGGWMTLNDPAFKNQGDCVSYVNGNTH
jgi:hypothetical protein